MKDSLLTIRELADYLKLTRKNSLQAGRRGKNSWLQGWRIMALQAVGYRGMDSKAIRAAG